MKAKTGIKHYHHQLSPSLPEPSPQAQLGLLSILQLASFVPLVRERSFVLLCLVVSHILIPISPSLFFLFPNPSPKAHHQKLKEDSKTGNSLLILLPSLIIREMHTILILARQCRENKSSSTTFCRLGGEGHECIYC